MFIFEKLDVWHKSVALADLVYGLTKSFPSDERFGLTNQMRRAAVSVSSNLAEGCSRGSKPDFSRFIEIATVPPSSSSLRLESQKPKGCCPRPTMIEFIKRPWKLFACSPD
jgi:hypothetical protein